MRPCTLFLLVALALIILVSCCSAKKNDYEDFTEEVCKSDLPKAPKKGYWRHMFYAINEYLERLPRESSNHTHYYNIATDYLRFLRAQHFSIVPTRRLRRALKLVLASNQLELRNCDRCAYLITKANCDAGTTVRACYGPGQPHMILGKVLNRRLMEHVAACEPVFAQRFYERLEQFDVDVYKDVTRIGKQFAKVSLNNNWKTVEDMFAGVNDPAKVAVNLIVPDSSFVTYELVNLMLELDESSAQGRNGSLTLQINSDEKITLKDATDHFYRLILKPCRKYMDVFKEDILEPAEFYSDIRSFSGKEPPLRDELSRQIYYPALLSYDVCNNINRLDSYFTASIWNVFMEKQRVSASANDRQMREKMSIF